MDREQPTDPKANADPAPVHRVVMPWSPADGMVEVTRKQRRSRQWSDYPIGSIATSITGGHWFCTEHGWKWNGPDGTGGTFPTPGADVYSVFVP